MSDNDREQKYAEPDEGPKEGSKEEPQEERRTYHEERTHTTVDYTGPVTRLLGVAGAIGMVVLLGFYLQKVGLGEQFGTVAVIAVVFSLGYWADKRPDRLERRAGPFWRIASAIRESREDLREYTYARPLRVAITLSVAYGVVIVLIKSALVALLASLYSWQLAAAIGAGIGALVIAPSFFRDIWTRMAQGPADYADYHRERRERRDFEDADEYEEEYREDEYEDADEEENAR